MSERDDLLARLTPAQRAVLDLRLKSRASNTAAARRIGKRSGAAAPSFAQQRLWFMEQVSGGTANHVVTAMRLRGPLRADLLEAALCAVVARHEVLRSGFTSDSGRPVLRVVESARPVVEHVAAVGATGAERLEDARAQLADAAAAPFDLAVPPLVRARIVRIDDQDHACVIVLHHIVADGWSVGVLHRELAAFYDAGIRGAEAALLPLPLQYADFAAWQRELGSTPSFETHLAWWREHLQRVPLLDIPLDHPRPPVASAVGARVSRTLSADTAEMIAAFGRAQGSTLFAVLLAAFQTLLSRWSGQGDFAIGTPTAGRQQPELEGLVGLFVNQLVLRTGLDGDPTFAELTGRVRASVAEAITHQDVPFERLVEELGVQRSLSQAPLTPVIFSLQNLPAALPAFEGLQVDPIDFERRVARFDLSVFATPTPSGLHLSAEYRVDLFEEATAARLLERFERLLCDGCRNPDRRVSQLQWLGADERRQLLTVWNETAAPYDRSLTVPALVRDHARVSPRDVAVSASGRAWTYGELVDRAGAIASALIARKVGPEEIVGLCCERGFGFVAGALGIMMSGAAYAPIDPRTPVSRRDQVLRNVAARWLLVEHDDITTGAAQVLALSDLAQAGEIPPVAAAADHLAYVIHTSGTTGVPKGVAITHGGLSNLVAWHRRVYPLGLGDRTAQVASVGFDACVWEIWPTLCAGAALHVPDDETKDRPELLWAWADRERITSMFLPTPQAELALQSPLPASLSLRWLLTGGDRLHAAPLSALPFAYVNHYGPTESTVVATAGAVVPGRPGPPSIGRPIDNTRTYVLDEGGELVAIGALGELWIAGDGLARGYVGAPRLTAERFVPDPFATAPGSRMYRTGDVVRLSAQGELAFIGRRDHQVKIRGHRIELGDIEAALSKHPHVRAAVVSVIDAGDRVGPALVAHVVWEEHIAPPTDLQVKTYLRELLPDYMVPTFILRIDGVPLTTHGKVNREALPRPDLDAASTRELVAPANEVEEIVHRTCAALLSTGRISMSDSFFDIGGHSLIATQLASRLSRELDMDVSLRSVFEAATLRELAEKLLDRLLAPDTQA